ncbi:indolethylamine N-methyltransferase-like [Pelobates fuscus]|uniref:indolethylamine N-methyltransferase-like n=1 Tax=Pelobates fuscus TaxID=191477 RepID=UPI002FE4695C
MSSTAHKDYHDKAFPAKKLVEVYFCDDSFPLIKESLEFPMEEIHKDIDSGLGKKDELSSGNIVPRATLEIGVVKGETLIDFSVGATASHLIPVCNGFKDIYVVEVNERNINEFEKWRQNKQDAVNFSYGAKVHHKLEGGRKKAVVTLLTNYTSSDSRSDRHKRSFLVTDIQHLRALHGTASEKREAWHMKEDKARQAIKGVIQWDISNDDQVPVDLPQADCILSLYLLNVISKDKDTYQRNLKKMTSRLKIGGSLLLFSPINMTFYIIDDHKFFVLPVDEDFVKQTVNNAGFVIEKVNVLPSKKSCDLVDYDSVIYLRCRKKNDV